MKKTDLSALLARRFFWLALLVFIPLSTFLAYLLAKNPLEYEFLSEYAFFLPYFGAFFGILLALIFRAFLRSLLKKIIVEEKNKLKVKKRDSEKVNPEIQNARDNKLFLHLISSLQKEARLLDFFAEDLSMYEDEDIGAAVRSVHENSKKTLIRYIDMAAVMEEEESSEVIIPEAFDPLRIKLTGRVVGDPPFKGVLRHRGWRAKKVRLPVFNDFDGKDILAPCEVEVI